jgi:hypothetical protein
MAIEENKQVVLDWIQSGCNYEQGAMLYSQFGKNNFLKKDFPGKQYKPGPEMVTGKSVNLFNFKTLFNIHNIKINCHDFRVSKFRF